MTDLKETPSQTAGPYVHIGLAPAAAGFAIYDRELGFDPVPDTVPGERIRITGQVIDGMGAPVRDVLIETWQADAQGRYPGQSGAAEGFTGWSRVVPDFDTGTFSFRTIRPGAHGRHAPHIALWLVARGINVGLQTRLYLADEEAANAADPVLSLIEPAHRRRTLIAQGADGCYHFDIRLQGPEETVFFDV